MEDKKHILAINAIVVYQGKILIIKRNPTEIAYPWKWAMPGGKLERWETIHKTLVREIKEEVGLDIQDKIEFSSDFTFVRPDWHNVVWMVFKVYVDDDKVVLNKEFDDYKWIYPKEISNYDVIEWIIKDVKKAFWDK